MNRCPRAAGFGVAVSILLLAGCAAKRPAPGAAGRTADASLATLGTDPADLTDQQLRSLVERSAQDMNRLQDALAESARPSPKPVDGTIDGNAPLAEPEAHPETPALPTRAEASAQPVETPPLPPPERIPTRPERIAELTHDLGQLLREEAVESDDPLRWCLVLAGLEPLEPGLAAQPASTHLSAADQAVLSAARTAISGLSAGASASGDPGAARDVLLNAAGGLHAGSSVVISHAALCSGVKGFGQYTPVTGNAFLAGRPHKVYVYTEVENFGHRAIADTDRSSGSVEGDRWAVDLTLEVQLRLTHDDSLQVMRPAQRIVQTSRRKRRDFFVWRELELPPTLSVGAYSLKIIVRDMAAPDGPVVAEEVLNLRVVADPALATGG